MGEAKVTIISNNKTIMHFPVGTRSGVAILPGTNEVKSSVWATIATSKYGIPFIARGILVGPAVSADAEKAPSTAEIVASEIANAKEARESDDPKKAMVETNKAVRKGK